MVGFSKNPQYSKGPGDFRGPGNFCGTENRAKPGNEPGPRASLGGPEPRADWARGRAVPGTPNNPDLFGLLRIPGGRAGAGKRRPSPGARGESRARPRRSPTTQKSNVRSIFESWGKPTIRRREGHAVLPATRRCHYHRARANRLTSSRIFCTAVQKLKIFKEKRAQNEFATAWRLYFLYGRTKIWPSVNFSEPEARLWDRSSPTQSAAPAERTRATPQASGAWVLSRESPRKEHKKRRFQCFPRRYAAIIKHQLDRTTSSQLISTTHTG